jgi:TetR/AcrR family transcriptional regulator, cholesterol catabolism regulator
VPIELREAIMKSRQGGDAEPLLSGRRSSRGSGRRRAGSDQEQRLLSVAARMFKERGYDATSVQEIADEVGLLKGSLYHYIRSKDDLLWAIIMLQHRSYLALAQRCRDMTGSPVDKLTAFIRGYAESLEKDYVLVSVYLHELNQLSPDRRMQVIREREIYSDFVRNLLAEGIVGGEFRSSLDPGIASSVVLGMLNSVYRWYRPGGQYTPQRIVEECLTIVLHGALNAPVSD